MHSLFVLPVDYYLAAWFALTAACTLYVAIDGAKNPEPSIMKWGFVPRHALPSRMRAAYQDGMLKSVGLCNAMLA
ncbi:MAG: hypothetical protein FJX45_12985 [Alphaproteobacteria bacterium]|nr:hypothetical protein [Alphaproteobacteria bacterium]MBM3652507.1 hypothetical protein [Alphaproteobacteria bacterium]